MTTSARQNNLILNQDWTRIYQTFRNADFKSYDFENLRRVIITYLRENYPEDFNDYIESSEYLALIDAIAFLGQSLSFRIDLASRENFIELAERRESVLRLARMLSYNPKRNVPSMGLLKFDTVSTTESVIDGNGRNLAQQTIVWDDPTNPNWPEQFISILNAAMVDNTEFGRSQGSGVIQGIATEQYRFKTVSADIPIFNFTKTVAGRQMVFELVSTGFTGSEELYEEAPFPGNQVGFIYKNDQRGGSSANTGFFMMFKQGSLEVADFAIDAPTTNEVVAVDSDNINNNDIWLYSLDSRGAQAREWTKVSSLIGNNIAFNSISANIRNIYNVVTKENDRVDLVFADGVYGNLPQGAFRVYYRVSNGLVYQVSPQEMKGISITVPYFNRQGVRHILTISMSLKNTVNTATPTESTAAIRRNAPAQYYTQNRMITGEDYNLAPLTSSQNILKVKAVNRTSSGVSRNFDIIDASGKYSSVNVFADDGLIYREEIERSLAFKFVSRSEVFNFIKERIEPIFTDTDVYNYYLTKYNKILFTDSDTTWTQVTSDVNNSSGYFVKLNEILKVGVFTTNTLKYIFPGALVKFVPPAGFAFKRGKLVEINSSDPEQTDRLWTKVVKVVGDGTNAGRGQLASGLGPIEFSDTVPADAIANQIVPKFVNNISDALEVEIVNLMIENVNFGLRYDIETQTWGLIGPANIDLVSEFSLGKSGDTSNTNIDPSWIVAFVREADRYAVRVRGIDYVFGSIEQNRFYVDSASKIYDANTGKVVKNQVNVLSINTDSNLIAPLKQDIPFETSSAVTFNDGYQSTEEIKIAFFDNDDDGVIDNPDSFEQIVGSRLDLRFLFFKEIVDTSGNTVKEYVDNSDGSILIQQRETQVNINDPEFTDGRLVYFYDSSENVVKRVDKSTNTFILESEYIANVGRAGLKFQYIHNAGVDRRIDPSRSNIMDVYLLTRNYDTAFRNFLRGSGTRPEAPTSDDLRINFSGSLNSIKSISDEIIYHPVKYKILFGDTADLKLQADFLVVKNPNRTINDNDLKVRIVNAIDEFFAITNWDFGDKFYLSELITFITNSVAPDVSNMGLVPRQPGQPFGSLFEMQSQEDEIFLSGATVDNIEIVSALSAAELNLPAAQMISPIVSSTARITGSNGGGY
jgi:hypothetical protein